MQKFVQLDNFPPLEHKASERVSRPWQKKKKKIKAHRPMQGLAI